VTTRAIAHANIALAKYWGKADIRENLPAVPSLSLTLDGLRTITDVTLDPALERDEASLDGKPLSGRPLERIVALLDRVRARAARDTRVRVVSVNEFPTAAGLASSASGFAALASGACHAFGLETTPEEISDLARASSASAARSVFGGFVALDAKARSAVRVAPGEHFPLSMVVTLTASGPKATGSTEGMQHTAATSPYYAAWLQHAPRLFEEIRRAVLAKDLGTLGAAVEQSALMMHASMWAARPAVVYFTSTTLSVMQRVRELRDSGTPAFCTMDAGPHVKVLTLPEHATDIAGELRQVEGVRDTIVCHAGPDARAFELETGAS